MDGEVVFRILVVVYGLAYIGPRFYYRCRAAKAGPTGESELRHVSENKLRLVLMGISGLGADCLSIAWAIEPAWLRWARLPLPLWASWAGAATGVFAVWLGYLAHRTLDTSFTATLKTLEDHRFVTDGIYRWIRHPMYTSFFAILATNFLLTLNGFIGGLGLIYALLIIERVGHEEEMLLETFGEAYESYVDCTGRFFPRLVPGRSMCNDDISQT